MGIVKNDAGREIMLRMVRGIQENKAYLGEIDGLIGDGDHGMNMNKGFTLYSEDLGDEQTTFADGLFDLGTVLFNKIGGSMGPIYGTLFMDMSEVIEDEEEIDLTLWSKMLETGLESLYDIVDARPGDKTLIDTLYPAVESIKKAEESGECFEKALEDMKVAARQGMESTKDLVAQYGRSARLGERSRNVVDAGATSCYILLESIADGMLKLMVTK